MLLAIYLEKALATCFLFKHISSTLLATWEYQLGFMYQLVLGIFKRNLFSYTLL